MRPGGELGRVTAQPQAAPAALLLADFDRAPGRQPVARPERLHRRLLCRKTGRQVPRPHPSPTRRARDLVIGEDASEIAVAEARQGVLDLVDRDEVDPDGHRRPTGGRAAHSAALSAWSMSSMRSSTCSMPIESRIVSGATPTTARASGESWRCVVEAGWATSDLASPMLTSRLKSLTESKKRIPAS